MGKAEGLTVNIKDVPVSIFAPQMDKAAIDGKYSFIRLSDKTDYFEKGRAVLALPVLKGHIQSVSYQRSKERGVSTLYIMTPKDAVDIPKLRAGMKEADLDAITAEEVKAVSAGPVEGGWNVLVRFGEIDLFRLLLNASFNSDIAGFSYDNTAERVWIYRDNKKNFSKIITVCALVNSDYSFDLRVQTFSGEPLKDYIRYPAGECWDSMPKYVYHASSMQMLPDTGQDKDEMRYVKKACGKKSELKFLGFGSYDEFCDAKIGFLCMLEETFNKKYKGIASISHRTIPEVTKNVLASTNESKKDDIREISGKVPEITIVDLVKDDISQRVCTALLTHLGVMGIATAFRDKPKKDASNLVIVHDPEWYKDRGKEDVYIEHKKGTVIQHVILENIKSDIGKLESFTHDKAEKGQSNPIVQAILHNLQFKKDMENGRINAVDLSGFKRTGAWQFGIRKTVQDEKNRRLKTMYYGFLELGADNGIRIWCGKGEAAVIKAGMEGFADIADRLSEEDKAECILEDESGNIVTITDTGLFPLPYDLSLMKDTIGRLDENKERRKLEGGESKGRQKSIRGHYALFEGTEYEIENPRMDVWGALGDINYYTDGDSFCYYVDEPGKGMNTSQKGCAHIRKIEGENAAMIGSRLLPTFKNIEIRNGLPSVLPFACKYIREKMAQEFPELRQK